MKIVRHSLLILFLCNVLVELSAQNPVMIITCRNIVNALDQNRDDEFCMINGPTTLGIECAPNMVCDFLYEDYSAEVINFALDENGNLIFHCVPDCAFLSCCSGFRPIYNPDSDQCECLSDDPSTAGIDPNFCECPDGTIEIDDPNNPGETLCYLANCFEGDLGAPLFTRDCTNPNLEGMVQVTFCGVVNGSFITLDELENCDAFTDDGVSFGDLPTGDDIVFGPADINGCISVDLVLDLDALEEPTITINGEEYTIPSNPPCPEISDPCSCSSPFNTATGLYTDVLTVVNLSPMQIITLQENSSGFYDVAGNIIPVGTTFTANASGELTFTFYRFEGDQVNIVLDNEIFISDSICPTRAFCEREIPTLGQWGLMSLSLLLLIIGTVSYKHNLSEKRTT